MSIHAIEIPDNLSDFVLSQTAAGGYQSPSAYLEAVLTELWKTTKRNELTELLLSRMDAADRGEATEVPADYFDNLRKKLAARAARKNAS